MGGGWFEEVELFEWLLFSPAGPLDPLSTCLLPSRGPSGLSVAPLTAGSHWAWQEACRRADEWAWVWLPQRPVSASGGLRARLLVLSSGAVTSSGSPHHALPVSLNPACAVASNSFIKFSNESAFSFGWDSAGTISGLLTALLAFYTLSSQGRGSPALDAGTRVAQARRTSVGTCAWKMQHLIHQLNLLQSPICRAVRFLPDQEAKTQLKNDIPNIFWRNGGKEEEGPCRMGSWAFLIQVPTLSCRVLIVLDQPGQSEVGDLAN